MTKEATKDTEFNIDIGDAEVVDSLVNTSSELPENTGNFDLYDDDDFEAALSKLQ